MKEVLMTDRELVNRINSGDKEAFRMFIKRFERLVEHIVFRLVDNNADREDLCQDVFLKAYRNLSGFGFRSQLSTWIGRIAYNTCVNYLKKMKTPLMDDESDEGMLEGTLSSVESADSAVESGQQKSMITNAVSKLPPKLRTVITLYHLHDMSYAEIGEITGMPEGTVKSYLFRARKSLRDILEKSFSREELAS